MFDGIARRYDLLNRLLSLGLDRRWRHRAVACLAPAAGDRFLDVGSGTGEVCLEIARQSPNSHIVGIDPARRMLDLAARKVREAGLEHGVSFQVADAADLPFEDGSFSGVITAFTVRNIADRARAMGEMFRVIQSGGRLVILELTAPAGPVLRILHRGYNHLVVPVAGRLLSHGDAYEYLVRSIEDFPEPLRVVEEMAGAGLREAQYVPISGGIVTLFTARR